MQRVGAQQGPMGDGFASLMVGRASRASVGRCGNVDT